MRHSIKQFLQNEAATLAFGESVAALLTSPVYLYLTGDLGAGKTTFTRGVLRGLGYSDRVKSPTYTLIESYQMADRTLHHLDLYRLGDPEELEFIGLRDLIDTNAVFIFEWPERGQGWLPEADVILTFEYTDGARKVKMDYKTSKLLGNPEI